MSVSAGHHQEELFLQGELKSSEISAVNWNLVKSPQQWNHRVDLVCISLYKILEDTAQCLTLDKHSYHWATSTAQQFLKSFMSRHLNNKQNCFLKSFPTKYQSSRLLLSPSPAFFSSLFLTFPSQYLNVTHGHALNILCIVINIVILLMMHYL